MRVLQLGPLYNNHLRRWSSHAAALGCRVFAAGHLRPGRRPVDLSGLVERVHFAPERLYGREPAGYVAWLRPLLEELRPDVIQAHWLPRWGLVAARSDVRPVIATPLGSDLYLPEVNQRAPALEALLGADAVIALSEHMRREMIEWGVSEEGIHRVDLGVDLERFRPGTPAERTRLREQLGLPGGPLILSFRSGIDFYNLDVVLEAFRLVRRRIPDVSLVMVHGDAPLSDRVRRLLADSDGVWMPGDVPHARMHSYMRAASVGISIPPSDGSPSSVWEALASGVPVVLSDLPQISEKAGDCEAVALVEPRPEHVAAALVELLGGPERTRLSARAWAEANVDELEEVGRLGELYAAMAGRAAGSPARSR